MHLPETAAGRAKRRPGRGLRPPLEARHSAPAGQGSYLAALPDRERQLLTMRYGLDGQPPRTLERCGEAFGITRERARQIETSALRRLQFLPEAQALREAG